MNTSIALEAAPKIAPDSPNNSVRRIAGLDGLRGLAALYVVAFHCWLVTFGGFPANPGPSWLGWLMYGRIAVVFFLILSGFSLALSPAASGWRLNSVTRFARRRAFRILPPYWAALAISLAIAATLAPASHLGPPTRQTAVVYALVVQDIFAAPTPNGAFWSIAVEVELYIVFPVLIFLRRRLGPVGLLAIALLPVVVFGLLSTNGTPMEGVNRLAPNLAPVFAAGILAASAVTGRAAIRRIRWHWLSLATGVPAICLIAMRGSVWTVNHYFWIDLAVVPSMVFFIVAVAVGRPSALRRLLDSAPVRILGSFSYSLYLIHLPVVMVISRRIVKPHVENDVRAFLATLLIGVPLSLLCAWLFAKVFEAPFRNNRSWRELMTSVHTR